MILYFAAVFSGLIILLWSADQFVGGAAKLARHLEMSPLLIGMIIVGFGTSAPEMVVSASASMQGNPGLALGNAYGSNIANIGLILGITSLISPIVVHSAILKKELPFLTGITTLAIFLLLDGILNRYDAWIFMIIFFGFELLDAPSNRPRPPQASTGASAPCPLGASHCGRARR